MQTRESFDDYGGLTEVPADGDGGLRAAGAEGGTPPPARSAQVGEDEDAGAREPLVPRGTFASELPERGAEVDERESARGESPKSPRPPAPAPGNSQRLKAVRAAPRPPYLASEILREDLAPSEPGRRLLNIVLQLAPAFGAAAALSSGIHRSATWVALALLAGLFLLTRFDLTYATKALLVAALGGSSLLLTVLWRVSLGASVEDPLLAAATTLLPAALLFRSWHRASGAARLLVAIALALAFTWAAMTSHRELLSLAFEWQSWVPALTWYLFSILCLLSLLAFMDAETTGGCDVWAIGLWGWYALYACTRFALESTGEYGGQDANFLTLGLVEPAFAVTTSVALAQLFVRTLGPHGRRAEPATG